MSQRKTRKGPGEKARIPRKFFPLKTTFRNICPMKIINKFPKLPHQALYLKLHFLLHWSSYCLNQISPSFLIFEKKIPSFFAFLLVRIRRFFVFLFSFCWFRRSFFPRTFCLLILKIPILCQLLQDEMTCFSFKSM